MLNLGCKYSKKARTYKTFGDFWLKDATFLPLFLPFSPLHIALFPLTFCYLQAYLAGQRGGHQFAHLVHRQPLSQQEHQFRHGALHRHVPSAHYAGP